VSVATHLGIDLAEYDARIRTFIPHYQAMLVTAASAIPSSARLIVDLGTGTGALAAACLARATRARVVGIDADPGMLPLAARRLASRATLVRGSFLRAGLPDEVDAVVASFALHHVRTRTAKGRLYRRVRIALRPRGMLVSVDCHPSIDRAAARRQFDAWTMHLRRSYSRHEADKLLRTWSIEDVYVPLESEIRLLESAGFDVDVVWRDGAFAVLKAVSASKGHRTKGHSARV
jgi:SAM-dependent methyltransferase